MSALTPTLTAGDRRVLWALPVASFRDAGTRTDLLTVWQVAEFLDTRDVNDVLLTLNGLQHVGLAASAMSRSRKRRVWWRTAEPS